MAGIKHAFTSSKTDSADTTIVRPVDWNSDHQITGTITPTVNDGAALGSLSLTFSDLFLASGGVINWNADVVITHSADTLAFSGASVGGYTFDAAVKPSANDAAALGVSGTAWSDLFLASGGVINWVAADVTITHASNSLAFAGASSGYTFDATVTPATNDGAALGTGAVSFADVFLADGSVINRGNGGVTETHTAASDSLTLSLDNSNALGATVFNVDVDGARTICVTPIGICFNSDTAAANSLADYEEGTYSPTLLGSGTDPTVSYTEQSGSYVKVGSLVSAQIKITVNTISGGSGQIGVNLPFATGGSYCSGALFTLGASGGPNFSTNTAPIYVGAPADATVYFSASGSDVGQYQIDVSDFANGDEIFLSVHYVTFA